MRPIIRAEGVGKEYRIGTRREGFPTLRDALTRAVGAPLRAARRDAARRQPQKFWALRDVGFEVRPGEVVGIIGRNGAGKSTLLKILSRITEPTSGRIELYGRMASLLEVGTGFHPELTGRENVFLNGAILGMRREEIRRKFDEIIAFSEIERFVDTPVKHYSSGMYVRLAFAVAAHLEPEILIVDEVLAVGDAAFQKKCLGKMGDVAKQGRTVLFVSHNMGAVSSLCNRTIYLAGGQVQSIGPTESVVVDYMSEVFGQRVKDLNQLRIPNFGKVVRFDEIGMASDGEANLLFGRPVRFSLGVRSEVNMEDLSIGCSIYTATSNCVGALFTRETFSVKAGRSVALSLTVSNANLAPGLYYAGFSIGRGGPDATREDLDIVIGAPAFQVLPISDSRDPIANWHSNWGSIVFRDTELTVDKES
ncbi:MAG TPA: polysaccharide ABC transporter ATP-binding protein [Pyrinomonadaceae bacterium]|jgi:lipopolysaccharide transport system ATP-binding protein|nr:polysaccharide ABC transporter ATP-binding protein [Pyrinomonadaceae bacterium]